MKIIKFLCLILFVFVSISYAENICLEEEEIDGIIQQFEDDKNKIESYIEKEKKLREQKPIIVYEYEKNDKVIQTITIPIINDNPLQYKIEFKVKQKEAEGWFPMYLWLGGFVVNTKIKDPEVEDWADAKIGIKLLSGAPTNKQFIQNLGFNAALGLKSTGFTLSYKLPKPFNHTNIHLFYGLAYSTPIEKSFGIGASLNF